MSHASRDETETTTAPASGARATGDRSAANVARLIDFVRGDDGDYDATTDGIKFRIIKSSDAGFGLTARRLSDEKELQNIQGWGIAWLRTKKRCVKMAENILLAERAKTELGWKGAGVPMTRSAAMIGEFVQGIRKVQIEQTMAKHYARVEELKTAWKAEWSRRAGADGVIDYDQQEASRNQEDWWNDSAQSSRTT